MNRPSLNGLREGRVPAVGRGVGLRSDHPLLRSTEAVHYTARQWVHVAAVLTGSVIARIEGRGWAVPLACSAASVLLTLTVLLAAHKQRERDCAIELVLEGREGIRIAAVQHQRRRLLSEQTRTGLAGNLEDMICGNDGSGGASRRDRVAADRGGVCPGRRSSRALVERAVSPLYGQDVGALREELFRVRDLLRNGDM